MGFQQTSYIDPMIPNVCIYFYQIKKDIEFV